ncbi:MAG: hypothetical protein NXI04_02350 [Planctomycetaceae bacterium]|nr:hypothetical protein [Planctomycetaceae bacterium]
MESKAMEGTARLTRMRRGKSAPNQRELFLHDVYGPEDELPESLELDLDVRDPDTISELCRQSPEARDDFALQALRIGVLALRQARGVVDGDAVRKESDRLLKSMHDRMNQHAEAVQTRLSDVLRQYFDPQDGRFHERLDRLIRRDGELEEIMRRQVGEEDSTLRRTLITHLGEESKLMKLLSPDESRGLLSAMKETLEMQLNAQRDHVLQQFSLDNRDGALCRFLGELADRQGDMSDKLEKRIDDVVREFSLDDEQSALSRLVQNVDRAQRTITSEFSLDQEESALSRLKQLLEKTNTTIHQQLSLDDDESPLARLKREMSKLLEEQNKSSQEFQQEVRVALESMQVRKDEANRSTRHGSIFEEAVDAFVKRESTHVGDVASATGSKTGLIRNSKVGDIVIEMGPETAAPEARIVIEAKEDRSYTIANARAEIEVARKNRDSQVGIFVFSARTAAADIESFARYGDDMIVVWDAEDPSTDAYLKAAISVARALCVRRNRSREASAADFEQVDRAILEIEKQATKFDDIERLTGTIRSNADKVLQKLATCRKSFDRQTQILVEQTDILKDVLDRRERLY